MYYLSYGMNTNLESMKARCPDAEPMGGFYLPNYRLVFRGVADLVPEDDCIAPVVLWKITTQCLRSLDRVEGYPTLEERSIAINGFVILWVIVQLYHHRATVIIE